MSSFANLQWTVNAYNIAVAAGIICAAALGDRFGRRRLFCLGLGLFTVASAACALAPSAAVLIGARTAQGLGGAVDPAAQPDDPHRGVPGRAASSRLRHLRRPRRSRGRARPDRRRGDHRGDRLALDLLDQHPDRRRGDGSSRPASCRRRSARGRRSTSAAWPVHDRDGRHSRGASYARTTSAGQAPRSSPHLAWRSSARRVPRLGAPRCASDAVVAAPPHSRVRRRQRRRVLLDGVDLGRRVPDEPVLPVCARLLAAAERASACCRSSGRRWSSLRSPASSRAGSGCGR